MSQVVTFHLIRERRWRPWRAWRRLATDAAWFRQLDGVRFVRVLGTARGSSTGPSVAPGRVAVFVVWDSDADADRHDRLVSARWNRADEVWSCRLRPISATGRWAGEEIDVNGAGDGDDVGSSAPDHPFVVLTRAAIGWRSVVAFQRTSYRLSSAAATAPGCRAVVGFGEVPIVRLGTFSVWDDAGAATTFANEHTDHHEASLRARDGGWFTEELFARFEPVSSSGTWDGENPVFDVVDSGRPAPSGPGVEHRTDADR